MGQIVDARVKQAIINSKQQAFKNLNSLATRGDSKNTNIHQDQIAKPAEVQTDISRDISPISSASPSPIPREFYPSPEVSPLYNRENELRDHFHPLNQYYRPVKQDARFPTDTTFSSNPILDTRWLGGNRSPIEASRPPLDFMSPPQPQQGRSTNVDYPFYGAQVHQNVNRLYHNPPSFSEEKFTFPTTESPSSDELRTSLWPSHVQVPALNYKQPDKPPKGQWKWIPDDESETRNVTFSSETDSKSPAYPPSFYESSRPLPSRDRPYSFDSPDTHNYNPSFHSSSHPSTSALIESSHHRHHHPTAWASSGSDTLLSTEEYIATSGKHDESGKKEHESLDIKLHR